ncbi:TPA: hypothetical protein QEM47_000943 [Pseudomonas putida]|uniref:hypothetical protein n=1 Tax=Pseudomonas putida TaxID=303 RepID=UPI002063BDE7|nr:hypothetical protein [Pseudomonas putida]MDD2116706.1 hypothetical protein [Pseudomonas putida]UPU94028.1 hypothetical protein M0766_06485 [Pseudomonas putida]HDS1728220.1 hypothetical protein [Pseudomonas putida]
MPTENRSSNTEMVSVPAAHDLAGKVREALDRQACPDAWMVIAYEAVVKSFPTPALQPHPEPIAWMVGTAFWWTKEEAEKDAANTGLPIVDLGPMTGAAEVDRLRVELGHMREERDDLSAKLDRFYSRSHGIKNLAAIEELSDKLAERDALLRDKSGDLIRIAAHLISAPLFALQDLQGEDKKMTGVRVDHAVDVADGRLKDAAYELRRIADALSASAGPSSPTWSCQACQAEQPTDRACDACGGQTALIAAES